MTETMRGETKESERDVPRWRGMQSTLQTSASYLLSLVSKAVPMLKRSDEVTAILKWMPISERLFTAGQPTKEQLASLARDGFEHVVNLAPHGGANSLRDEAGLVRSLGMRYTYVPVDFKNPTEADFAEFSAAMKSTSDEKVLVHCAANMRASAFVYRYRVQVLGESVGAARSSMEHVWEPLGVWAKFVARSR